MKKLITILILWTFFVQNSFAGSHGVHNGWENGRTDYFRSTAQKRHGNYSGLFASALNSIVFEMFPATGTPDIGNDYGFGIGIYPTDLTAKFPIDDFIQIYGSSLELTLRWSEIGNLILEDANGVSIDSAVSPVALNQWSFIEGRFQRLASGGYNILVNGVVIMSGSGKDFLDSGSLTTIRVFGEDSCSYYLDDLYTKSGISVSTSSDSYGVNFAVSKEYVTTNVTNSCIDSTTTTGNDTSWANIPPIDGTTITVAPTKRHGCSVNNVGDAAIPAGSIFIAASYDWRVSRSSGAATNDLVGYGKNNLLTYINATFTTSLAWYYKTDTTAINMSSDVLALGVGAVDHTVTLSEGGVSIAYIEATATGVKQMGLLGVGSP